MVKVKYPSGYHSLIFHGYSETFMRGGFIVILLIYILGLLSETICTACSKEQDAKLDKEQELYCVRFVFLCSPAFLHCTKDYCTLQSWPEKFRLLDLEEFSI